MSLTKVKKSLSPIFFLLVVILLIAGTVACTKDTSANTGKAPTQYNPASDRIDSLAGIPPESDHPSNGIIPNLVPIVGAGRLAAANLEAENIKTICRNYLADHTVLFQLTSDDLQPYISGSLKAKYYMGPDSALITRVDIVTDGWIGMVFSLSRQKWIEGITDNDHPEDQDIP
jgi:hypothetical protein